MTSCHYLKNRGNSRVKLTSKINIFKMVRTKESSMRIRRIPSDARLRWAMRELHEALQENEMFRRVVWEQAAQIDVLRMTTARWRAAAEEGGLVRMVGTEVNPIVLDGIEDAGVGTVDDPIMMDDDDE